ncbi:MAG: M23 family peptidase, partial [Gallionella sp.]
MLPQKSMSQERKMKLRWFVTLSTMPLLGVVTAFGLVPQSEIGLDTKQLSVQEIPLSVSVNNVTESSYWRNERVLRGDTVAELLRRMSVEDVAASEFLRTNAAAESLRKLGV